ncbi:MAG: hypothetical protein IKK33_14325 [Lachnospiraceae bacterium]|nr:hypothetical protein [Lachnospiraceae bacterium]
MNSITISLFVLLIFFFHMYTKRYMRLGKLKEALSATWFMDTVFTICGIVVSFYIYHYNLTAFFTLRNILLVLTYLLITLLFILLAPSGLHLLTFKKRLTMEELLCAEYRFNDTLCMVRNFLLCLLFFVPIMAHLPIKSPDYQKLLLAWENSQIPAGFYFTVFLLLLPITLRQTFYWIKSLKQEPTALELHLMRHYILPFYCCNRNFFV